MSDFQKPVGGKGTPAPEPVPLVPPVEKDKKGKEEQYAKAEQALKERSILFASFYVYLKKLLSFLMPRQKAATLSAAKELISEDLAALRKLLLTLSQNDVSHDPEYLQQLSEVWHIFLENFNQLLSLQGKITPFAAKVKNLLDSIETYPPDEEHSLGFYLREYVGREWLPFPFMELLQQLHLEHQASPETSHLAQWIGELDNLLL